MKISPVFTGGGMPGQSLGNVSTERTSPDRIAAAKAVAMGEMPVKMSESDTPTDPTVRRMQETMRKIKMKTNQTTGYIPEESIGLSGQNNPQSPNQTPTSVISDGNEGSDQVAEVTKPLSPQAAALAKQRRALQVKARELADRERALQAQPTTEGGGDLVARLKSQPLSVLQEVGAMTPEFYNSLTEYLTSGPSGVNPEIQALRDEIKALKEGVDKNFTERDTQAEQQVLSEMRKEAETLARDGDTFELVRETRSIPKVIDLIHRTYKQTGEVLDVTEALNLVENELLERNLKVANFKKIQAKFQTYQPTTSQPQQRLMRTLTNRDTAVPPMDRKTRAILAATGQLKRG